MLYFRPGGVPGDPFLAPPPYSSKYWRYEKIIIVKVVQNNRLSGGRTTLHDPMIKIGKVTDDLKKSFHQKRVKVKSHISKFLLLILTFFLKIEFTRDMECVFGLCMKKINGSIGKLNKK